MAALVLLIASMLVGPVPPPAQAGEGLTGRWVLVSAKPVRPAYDQFWLGTEASLVFTPETFEITRVNPAPERKARFILGKESQNVYEVDGRRIVRDSRATFSKGLLLISTDTTTEDGKRWLSNIMRWSLDPDGMLTVNDTEICGSGECPSIITVLRFKRQ
jgi:hypothetical protein